MLSKIEGKNYVILTDVDSRYPEKVNKARTDRLLASLRRHMQAIADEMARVEEKDPTLYHLVSDWIFNDYRYTSDEDAFFRSLVEDIDALMEQLESDDVIPEVEDVALPEDFGYRREIIEKGYYTKTLEDTDEREVIEEIIARPELILRRIRTIEWEKTDYGKSSKSIKYMKKPIGKKLMKAIENAIAMQKEKD